MRRCEWVVPGKRLLRILLQCLPCGCLDKSCLERSQHICAVSEDHNINSRTHKQSQGSQAQIQIHILKCKHRCILFGALGQGHGTWLMWPTMPLGDGDANGKGGGWEGAYMLFTWPLDISYVSPDEAASKITFQAWFLVSTFFSLFWGDLCA